MTNVGRSVSRSICDVDGHWPGTAPIVPGVLSYANKVRKPKATAIVHAMPNKAVTNRVFVRRSCKENDLRRGLILQQRVFHFAAEMLVPIQPALRNSGFIRFFLQCLEFTHGRKKESLASKLLKVISGGQTGV